MLFNSYDFLIFFPIVLIVYFAIPKKIRYIWLLVTSYYFYMCWNARYALLLVLSTVVTWLSGIVISKLNVESKADDCAKEKYLLYKKLTVAGSFVINLGILGFFKYFDFFMENLNRVLYKVGIQTVTYNFDILLPVGISFYTFQALSYTVDVYRDQIEAEKNPLKYALFVSFFPQLVAGPIEKSNNLLNQIRDIEKIKLFEYERIVGGFILMLWGYFMKMVIADRAAIFVDTVYDSYFAYGSIELIIATVLFAIQIYCDFAGYSLIAIGAAKVMGFSLMENFNSPYLSRSIREKWRKWHISLSAWFRDYLYIPLGGSRCSKPRHYFNIMVTFLVSGLWHGASWHYVVWGGLHGLYQVLEMILEPVAKKFCTFFKVKTEAFSFKLLQIGRTFALTCVAYIFFRADDLHEAGYIIRSFFTKWNPWVIFDKSLYNIGLDTTEMGILLIAIAVLLLVDIARIVKNETIEKTLLGERLWFRWAVIIILFFGIVLFGAYGNEYSAANFIYFQF